MKINFSQSDIEAITASFKGSLTQAVTELPSGEVQFEDIQRWAVQHNISTPGLLETVLKKNRHGGKSQQEQMPAVQ